MHLTQKKKFVVASFEDEACLLPAVEQTIALGVRIYDVYTPFCVHGLDKVLGLRESPLHVLGFVYGAMGTVLTLTGMAWILGVDWPIIYGGKPFWSLPSFIPITFEMAVLFAVLGMGLTFMYWSKLGFGVKKHHFDLRSTDDRMVLVVCVDGQHNADEAQLTALYQSQGAVEVRTQCVDDSWHWGLYEIEQKNLSNG